MGFDRNQIVLVMPESGEHCPTKAQGNVRRANILHITTHAECLVGQPEDSFTLFSNCDRWRLTNVNVDLLNLTQVDLVVLSACETEVDNTFGNGDEILGFGYLMQAAGARATIPSLWAVDDGGTQVLMGTFCCEAAWVKPRRCVRLNSPSFT